MAYTVVIIPQQSSLQSLEALRFFLWIKRRKYLEWQKDCLWAGLEILDQAQTWYHQRLEENREQPHRPGCWTRCQEPPARGCLIRSCIQRVNGRLGNLLCDPNAAEIPWLKLEEEADSSLHWDNTVLTQEVSRKSRQISTLEQERDGLLQRLREAHHV